MKDHAAAVLAHHGVKGMRWGVRGGVGSPTAAHPQSEDSTRATTSKETVKTSGLKALSNQDLQHLVTRINLEKQYKQLNPTKKDQVVKFVGDLLLGVGKQQVTRVATDVAAKQVGNLLKKG